MRSHNTTLKSVDSKPQFFLVLFLLAVAMGNIVFPPFVPLFSQYYLPVSIVFVLGYLFFNAGSVYRQQRYPILVLLTFLSFLPGFLVTPLNAYGETKFLAIIISALLVLTPSAFQRVESNLELCAKLILFASVGTSFLVVFLGEPDLTGRMTIWGLNPIGTGRVAGIGVVISSAFILIKSKNNPRTWLLFPAMIVCVVAAVQTGSRGPLLAILVSVTVLLLTSGKIKSLLQRLSVLAVLGCAAVLIYSSSILENTRIVSGDASGRDLLFRAALESVKAHPVGIGWGNFYSVLPSFSGADAYSLYPHNIFLEIGAEGGWLALIVFTLLLIAVFKNLIVSTKAGNQTAVIVLAVFVFFLLNASLSSDIVGNRLFWLSIGMALVPFSVVDKPTSKGKHSLFNVSERAGRVQSEK